MDFTPIIVAMLAAIPGIWGLIRASRSADAETVTALSDALDRALTAQKELQKNVEENRKKLDAAYRRIDELVGRERELLVQIGGQKADYERKIARLEAKVEILERQLETLEQEPLTRKLDTGELKNKEE